MQLFTSIDVNPNSVYYFCCNKSNRDKTIACLDKFPKLLCTSFSFEDQCLICNSDDNRPARSYRAETAENTADTICSFDKVLNGMMDTVDDTTPADKNDVEEDHIHNCWTAPPQSKQRQSARSPTAMPLLEQKSTAETIAFLDRAAKQMDKWEKAAKDRAKEREEKEKEITQALDKLNEATKKN
eukprot:7673271-Ditylum_brightwellii.AAC.1